MARRYLALALAPLASISPALAARAFAKLAPCDRWDGAKLMSQEALKLAFEDEQEDSEEPMELDESPDARPIQVCSECGDLYQYIQSAKRPGGHSCWGIECETRAAEHEEWMAHGDPDDY